MVSTRDTSTSLKQSFGALLKAMGSKHMKPKEHALSEVKLIIHNQFRGVELTSPFYVSNGAKCHLPPSQDVYFNSETEIGFKIDLSQRESNGALIYELRRNNIYQHNGNIISHEAGTTCIQLVMIWMVDKDGDFYVRPDVIEHDKNRYWDEPTLKKLIEIFNRLNIRHGPVEKTWLIHDNTVLMASVKLTPKEECYKLEITISEESIKDDTQRPWYFGAKK
jgi:hypothetical protein